MGIKYVNKVLFRKYLFSSFTTGFLNVPTLTGTYIYSWKHFKTWFLCFIDKRFNAFMHICGQYICACACVSYRTHKSNWYGFTHRKQLWQRIPKTFNDFIALLSFICSRYGWNLKEPKQPWMKAHQVQISRGLKTGLGVAFKSFHTQQEAPWLRISGFHV